MAILANRYYRLVLDSEMGNVTFNNLNNSDMTFNNINFDDLISDDDFFDYEYYNLRLLSVKLSPTSDTLSQEEMNFEMRISEIPTLGQVQNSTYLNELTLHHFTVPYGQTDMSVPTVNYCNNGNVFTMRRQARNNIRLRYMSLDKSAGYYSVVPDTNTGSAYGGVQLVFIVEPVKLE
jgi:hypothetical protein